MHQGVYHKPIPFLHVKKWSMSRKITTVTIPIPFKGAGNVIRQQEVAFEVYQIDGHYSLKPCLNADELRLANLPEELHFILEGNRPVSLRGKRDGNLHVIQDAVMVLREKKQLV
jgi:hypothetical protein